MNAALHKALAAAQLTETDVAAHLDVDPKTVRRWLSGTRPYPRHRWALAELLQLQEDRLWPQDSQEPKGRAPGSEHVQRVYAHRWQVPREVWWDLFSSAEQEIGILVYSGLFLADDAGMLELLGSRARDGVNVRNHLGDPDSQPGKKRKKEENTEEALPARPKNSFMLFRPLLKIDNIKVRTHSTPLYNSIYFTERSIFVNHHTYGFPAGSSPLIIIKHDTSPEMYGLYRKSFELAWQNSTSPKY